MNIFILDNYDSFTYNLVQRFGEIDPGLQIHVSRNDQVSLDEIAQHRPERIVISPGPCTPREAGVSCDIIQRFSPQVPILGVCLGHQCLGDTFGQPVVRAPRLMHGKTSPIEHDSRGLFSGLPNPFTATRYHSLIVDCNNLNPDLEISAWTKEGEVMGLRHRSHPLHGVQFHPESFLTQSGIKLLDNFLKLPAAQW